MSSKHTPGPWQHCGASGGKCICGRIVSHSADTEVAVLAGDEGAATGAEREANAALISAGPDMLAALQQVECYLAARVGHVPTSEGFSVLTTVRAAITEAGGA